MNALALDISEALTRQHPRDVVNLLQSQALGFPDLVGFSDASLARLLDAAEPVLGVGLLLSLAPTRQAGVLAECSTRASLQILGRMEDTQRDAFLGGLPADSRREMEKIRVFPENMAGYYMESTTGSYHLGDTVAETLAELKSSNAQRIRSIYVIDGQNRLAGRVDMQDIALADVDMQLADLLNPVEGFAQLTTPRDELMEIFNDYRVDSIPIVDDDHGLTGVVRYAALFKAAEESLTGDLQMMVGASPEEKALSSPWFAVRKRLPWLHINLLTAFLAASVVGVFESTIAQFTALAILLPVVAGQSGNAGSQALAVTMRGLALREINLLKWRQVMKKELQVGVVDGMALATTCGLGVFVWSGSLGLAAVIVIAMIISMIAAGIGGALVPMILIRFGQDPATASSIILTTVTDISGFVSFLGTATLLAAFL